MRALLISFSAIVLFSCNSLGKKDPNQAMDDTERMDNPVSKVEPVKAAASDLPSAVKVKGTIQEVWKWNDILGENFLITTYIIPSDEKGEYVYGEKGRTDELYAYHYAGKGNNYKEVWSLKEEERECPFDITLGFIPGSVMITDLDKDNIAEIKVQYSKACRSDVSPAMMKLLIEENGASYGLQGYMWIAYSPDFKYEVTEKDVNLEKLPKAKDETDRMLRSFGRYETERDFVNAPPEFLNYARSEWLKYSKEKMAE